MSMGNIKPFKDHFSIGSDAYTRYRPSYPPSLFEWLAGLTSGHDTVWDCGCGNGQAAIGLAPYFLQVIATDSSRQQIEQAQKHERIRYSVASAEDSGIADCSVDLIMVAQALHWFDFELFYREARRVARPDGVIAAISYGPVHVEGAPYKVVNHFYSELLARFWPPELPICCCACRYRTEDI